MGSTYELRTSPGHFAATWDGRRRFHCWKIAERIQVGDSVLLREWDSRAQSSRAAFTGRTITARVSHVQSLGTKRVVLGLSHIWGYGEVTVYRPPGEPRDLDMALHHLASNLCSETREVVAQGYCSRCRSERCGAAREFLEIRGGFLEQRENRVG